MTDDPRKQEVGRTCVLWSVLALAAHALVGLLVALGSREMLWTVLRTLQGAASKQSGGDTGVGM